MTGRVAHRLADGTRRLAALARTHWLFSIVLGLGLIGRALTMAAYWPALFYIDSLNYELNRFALDPTQSDPIGYALVLRGLLDLHQLSLVPALQHLLGLAMGVCVYALLVRKGAPRWLGALASAPVLLDAYQWQIEQNVLSDSLFLAMVTFALTLLAWNRRPSWKVIAGVGLIIGCATVVRTVGEVTVVPIGIYLLVVAGSGWRRRLGALGLLALLFAVPTVAYTAYTSAYTKGDLSSVQSSSDLLYGRAAEVANCSTVPSNLRVVCPPGSAAARKALGPDYFAHDSGSPIRKVGPGRENAFDRWVLEHQTAAVAKGVGEDFLLLFVSPRDTPTGATAISRWQFQTSWPVWSLQPGANTQGEMMAVAGARGSGTVNPAIAGGLRAYQLNGGFTPNWYFSAALLAALAGLFGASRRARRSRGSGVRAQVLLWTGTGLALLLGADIFEFSWRYQLPALVLLPMGGAFGIMALFGLNKNRKPLLESHPDAVDAEAVRDFHERYGEHVEFAPIVVVIAAYNEAGGIGAVLDKLPTECDGMAVEPLVVVDGASDGTAQVALDHGARTCVAPTNRGQGAALRLGYHLAYAGGAQYTVTTDADGQYDTSELPALLAPIVRGEADFVTGSRVLGSNESGDRMRQAGCRLFAALVSILMRRRVTDTSFGLRAMHAKVPVSVTLQQPQYQSSELLISVMAHGYQVAEVPMTIAKRDAGKTKKGNNFVYGSRYARVVLGTWRRERRSAKTQRSNRTNLATNTTP